jgi:cell division septal protein FtsQ
MFVSQSGISSLLMGDFKKIRSVLVTKKFPDTVEVTIDERKALLVWCSGDRCYLIDENGYAYGLADFNSPQLVQNHLLQISEDGAQAVSVGEKVIDPPYEQYVLAVKDALAKMGYDATDQYSTPSRMADEINVKTQQGPEFYFSTEYPLDSAMRTLDTIFKKEITADKKNDLAYVDLRNESKVFYKLNGQQSESQQPTDQPASVDTKKSDKKK